MIVPLIRLSAWTVGLIAFWAWHTTPFALWIGSALSSACPDGLSADPPPTSDCFLAWAWVWATTFGPPPPPVPPPSFFSSQVVETLTSGAFATCQWVVRSTLPTADGERNKDNTGLLPLLVTGLVGLLLFVDYRRRVYAELTRRAEARYEALNGWRTNEYLGHPCTPSEAAAPTVVSAVRSAADIPTHDVRDAPTTAVSFSTTFHPQLLHEDSGDDPDKENEDDTGVSIQRVSFSFTVKLPECESEENSTTTGDDKKDREEDDTGNGGDSGDDSDTDDNEKVEYVASWTVSVPIEEPVGSDTVENVEAVPTTTTNGDSSTNDGVPATTGDLSKSSAENMPITTTTDSSAPPESKEDDTSNDSSSTQPPAARRRHKTKSQRSVPASTEEAVAAETKQVQE